MAVVQPPTGPTQQFEIPWAPLNSTPPPPPEVKNAAITGVPDHDKDNTKQADVPPPTPPPKKEAELTGGVRPEAFSALFNNALEPNRLNSYYQPTYHFRLLMLDNKDVLANVKDIPDFLTKITSKKLPQITLAESGVTGATIREVVIETTNAQTALTKGQNANTFAITIIDPLGIRFLDSIRESAQILKVEDYSKVVYYLECTFTGYDESGRSAGRPISMPYDNGGIWLWGLYINRINAKINEGGGVFKLECNTPETQFVVDEKSKITSQQTLTVKGGNVKEIFDDYAKQITASWRRMYENQKVGESTLQTLEIDATEQVQWGRYQGRKINTFKLRTTNPAQNSIAKWSFDNGVTATVQAGVSAGDFITAVLQQTEEAQALFLDENATQLNSTTQKFKEHILFSIEPTVLFNGDRDTNSGNYIKHITLHVLPFYSQTPVIDPVQVINAEDPTVQQSMITALINNDMIRKRYDYIYTGKNTEVLDHSIEFNFAWSAQLARLAGARRGYNVEAVHALLNDVNKKGDTCEAKLAINPTTGRIELPALPAEGIVEPVTPEVETVLARLRNEQTPSQETGIASVSSDVTAVLDRLPAAAQTRVNPAASLPETRQNRYIEDVLDAIDQSQHPTWDKLPIPHSFWQEFYNVDRLSGRGMTGNFHNSQSVIGSIFTQIYGNQIDDKYQVLDLTIRGDPYWLGQTNIQREIMWRNGKRSYKGLPDYLSSKRIVYMYFRYPVTVGDDFVPVLKASESFNGLYEIQRVTHTFSDGMFKQKLEGTILSLIDMKRALSGDVSGTTGGSGSSSRLAQTSGASGTPGVASGTGGSGNPNEPRGSRNFNPTNLTFVSGQPYATGTDGRFGRYATMQDGIAAATVQLLRNNNEHGLTTTAQIIGDDVWGWANSKEAGNHPVQYANIVATQTGIGVNETINLQDPTVAAKFITGQIKAEGSNAVDPTIVSSGVQQGIAYYRSLHPTS